MDCRICGRDDSRIMCRKNTGICCLTCQKIYDYDITKERALDYLWSVNTKVALKLFKRIKKGSWVQNGKSK